MFDNSDIEMTKNVEIALFVHDIAPVKKIYYFPFSYDKFCDKLSVLMKLTED